MYRDKIIEPIGFFVALAALLFSFFLFYSDTGVFLGSFGVALMAAGLAWITYIILRWILLATRE